MCGAATPQAIDKATGEIRAYTSTDRIPSPDKARIQRGLGSGYEVGKLVGRGGFAEVFLVHDRRLKRDLALKALRPDLVISDALLTRFRREAETVAALRHPHIVPIYDIGESEGIAYILMPLIQGESLRSLLTREGPRPVREATRILLEAADALAAAHEAGVIHRDIKPENIMVTRTRDSQSAADVVKVCDFGLAKFNYDGAETTKTGRILGSPAYMAPEQARGAACDARADIYAVGVTLFEMLTGHLPHEASTVAECFDKKREQEARRVSSLVPEVDPLIDDIVAHALVADPTHRHATAADLGLELREALALAPRHDSTKSHVTIWPEG